MKARLLSTVCLLFVGAASSACGSSANPNAGGEDLGEVDQAFSETNCVNALPNTDGIIPTGRNPDNTNTGEMYWAIAQAPYTNPKCGGAWVAQVNQAYTGLQMLVSAWENDFSEPEGCEDRHVGLLVYYRVVTSSGSKGPWRQWFLGRSYAQWNLPGYTNRCHIPDIQALSLPPPYSLASSGPLDVKIIGTGRDPNNNTQDIVLFGEVW